MVCQGIVLYYARHAKPKTRYAKVLYCTMPGMPNLRLCLARCSKVLSLLPQALAPIEALHGPGRWLAVYGGDTFIQEAPDLGAAMHFLKNK